MGKRSAEKQLTQLNQFEEETDPSSSDQNSAQGFRKADQNTLAKRVIKVPKSRLRPTPVADAAAAADKPATSSAFSGFSGFGSPAAPAPAATATADSSNDTASESSSKGAFKGFSFGQPAASSKPTAAFGAFGATSSTSAFKMGAFGTTPAASKETTSAFTFGSAAAPSTTSEEPPKSAFTFGSKSSGGFSFGSKPAEEKKPAEDVKQPAAPSLPAFKPPTTVVASSPAFTSQLSKPTFTSGFVPPVAASSSSAMEVSEPSEEEFFKSIRGLNISLQKRIADALDANAFVDLTPLLQQYRDHWDSISKSNAPATTASQASAFDNSRLGAVSQPAPAPVPVPEPTAAIAPLFSFGATSSTPASAAPAVANGGFSFGFAKPSAVASATTTDGSTAESATAKTPFLFGFAKPADQATSSEEAKKPFSFGFGSEAKQPAAAAAADNDNEEGSGDEKEEEEEKRVPTTAGEEGETTEHQTRAKLYAWDKALNKYKDLGVGNFKVNTRPADNGGKRARFICRQEGSERITLNAAMFKAMTFEIANKRDIGILVITDNVPTRYLVRVKTAAMAQALFDTIERVRDQLPA
ncbi:hypothetical protein IWW37_002695 [Coemansia sp. RSA 2050]|nr:hypothetical protein IWW37_002695 [Coemansia sp. RSA 2050]KAJ2736282.1 hypothetical protein IW152_000842 [Coemansia sp. BCRC 34962]